MNANAALSECRRILNAPSRSAVWWSGLSRGDRRMLLIAARLPAHTIAMTWDDLPERSRADLIDAARRASAWAAAMVGEGGRYDR